MTKETEDFGERGIAASPPASTPSANAPSGASTATPGPWQIEPEAGRGAWISGAGSEWAALACGDTDERARANARLIAAAPDLLAACKEAALLYEDDEGIAAVLLNAIAKAEG